MFSRGAHKNIECFNINSGGVFCINTGLNTTISPELYSSSSGRCTTSETRLVQGPPPPHIHTHIRCHAHTHKWEWNSFLIIKQKGIKREAAVSWGTQTKTKLPCVNHNRYLWTWLCADGQRQKYTFWKLFGRLAQESWQGLVSRDRP